MVNKVHPARAEEALKQDLRDFELRSDKVNLQEWWKPAKKTGRTPATSTSPFGHTRAQDEEDAVFARDI